MRIETPINFSLVIPTRNRPSLLKQCVESFYNLAKFPHLVEFIILVDFDDITTKDVRSFLADFKENCILIEKHRTPEKIKFIDNYGAQCSTGKYIWLLNDEAEMLTKNWDSKLAYSIGKFLEDKPDRLLYCEVNDGLVPERDLDVSGTCYPILSKEFIDTINNFLPQEINAHGSDHWIHFIAKALKQDRILKYLVVELKANTQNDNTNKSSNQISTVTKLNKKEFFDYVNKLNDRIDFFNNLEKGKIYDYYLSQLTRIVDCGYE